MTALYVLCLLALAAIGAPLFVIVGAATALAFLFFTGDHGSLQALLPMLETMEDLLGKSEFLAIPLFMASGAVMTAGGIARRLVNVAKAGLGWAPGGVAVASVVACMFFAAISGSSPVTLIAVGSIMVPAMKQSNYPENFSIGLITTAGSLGCLVPPSISMLIYAISISGSAASVTPEDLFLAGLVPAVLIAGLLAVYAVWVGRKIPGSRPAFDGKIFRAAVKDGIWALLLPIIILGGIYGGLYTPSEAGAVALGYALLVTIVIYKELTVSRLIATMRESATLMGALILIIVLAFGLNEFLADIQINETLITWIRAMDLGPFGFLLLVNVVLIVIGALMDSISCTLIFAPILAPLAWDLYGIDPLHFGVVFVVNMEIGYLMPPVATNLFVAAAVFKKPFGQVTRAVLPTLAITIGALFLIMLVPTFSKAAVNWKRGEPIVQAFPWDGRAPAASPSGEPGAPGDGDGVAGPAGKEPAVDLSDITAKAMSDDDWDDDDEPDAAPAAAAAPDAAP